MKRRLLQRGLAVILSAAMLLTGTNYSSMTAKAAENTVYTDDMEAAADGWTTVWGTTDKNVTDKRASVGGTNNTGQGWNVWSQTAQTVTFTKTVEGLEQGEYKASIEALGDLVASGTISILEGETVKGSQAIQFGTWPKGEADVWETSITDVCAVEGTSIILKIEVDLQEGGWFWLDNVELKKVVADETEKEAKKAELNTLIGVCNDLNQADYQAESWSVLQTAISNAQAVLDQAQDKTITEINDAIKALEAAKNALVSAGVVENAGVNVKKVEGISDSFIRGVDISTYISLIDSGVKYKGWNGEVLDDAGFFNLLKDAGVNYVRIRVWNDPYADAQKKQGYGAGNCDVEKAARIGKWATDAGLRVLIDFHYSDFWADPGRQLVPKAWKGFTVDQKAEAVAAFTTDSLNTIIAAGADVGMVQVGNETTTGICGEKDWDNMAKIFQAGCNAVKGVDENILRAIHFTNPEKTNNMIGYAEKLKSYNIDYDVFASSYYPYWHGTMKNLTNVLKTISETYGKKVMVAETSWASTMEDGDGQPNVVRHGQNDDTSIYSATAQGQANEVRDVIEAVANVGTSGIGVMYWEPAWLPVNVYHADAQDAKEILAANKQAWETYGSGWASSYSIDYDTAVNEDNYGGSEWDNQAMFDFEGNPLPSLNVFKYVLTGASTPKRLDTITDSAVNVVNGGDIKAALPATVEGLYNDGTKVTNLPVVWNEEDIAAITNFGTYQVKGTVTYETEDGKTATIGAVCTVEVAPKNILLQGDFESGRDKWTIDGTGLNSKDTENPRSGKKCVAFYLDSAYELTVSQKVTVETPGTYGAFMYMQGGDAENDVTANIKLSNDTQNTFADADAGAKGWNVWQNPIVNDVKAGIGDTLTVTITITGKAKSWGSIDDVYLYLKKADPIYKVTYHLNGGENNQSNPAVFDGYKTIALADPSREGYTFKGWYTDSECKNKITEISKGIASDLELYAGWEKTNEKPEEYTIRYELNGGTNHADNPSSYTKGQKIELKDPTREGYTFKGWYTDSGLQDKFAGITENTTGNLQLYAGWEEKEEEPEEIKVKDIKLNTKSKKIARGKKFTLKAAVLPENATNPGIAWSSSNQKVAKVSENGVVTTIGPGTAVITAATKDGSNVTAECKVSVPYKITYKLNKGSNHKSNPTSYFNQKINLKNPVRKGYLFKGWYTDSKFKKKITSIAKSSKKDLTLYAKWSKVTVKKASLKKVTNVSKQKAKVVINKVSGAKGYQIGYTTDKKFKKSIKKVFVKKTTHTLAKLKKGKTYYVKVRAYKLDSKGEKVYGAYSKAKTVKIRK